MADARHHALHEYVAEKAGDAYRVSFCYDADGMEILHIRDDLASRDLDEELPHVYERVCESGSLVSGDDYAPLGETRATTEIHEHGVVLHFPEDGERGMVVSLDVDVARQLSTFVVECTSFLRPAEGDESIEGRTSADADYCTD
ncbi:hypothetical protein [Halarchaeum sp. P4]|uniref:hypothetical protein n=1 Tax=Halarchaeum sp. P4 TaxID=3421639 RepID=UPI003EBCA2D1